MARKTMETKFADAKKKYEAELKVLGAELQKALAAEIVPLIPEGWYLTWSQSDEQYNDEDYYFGLNNKALCTEMMPRKGRLLKAAFERKKTVKRDRYNMGTGRYEDIEEEVTESFPAEYEWILDDQCKKKRTSRYESVDEDEHETGSVIDIENGLSYAKPAPEWGADKAAVKALINALDSYGDEDYRRAFGDQATVRIYSDGVVEVD